MIEMEKDSNINYEQKGLEHLILLILGIVDRKISLLHLEKEAFLLWNFDQKIQPYLRFIKHYRGPFSKEIQETIQDPLYLEDHWVYIPPRDRLSGGYIELTPEGRSEYKRLLRKISDNEELLYLIAGIKMVRELYDKLTLEELLLLVYDTYPDYIEKSDVYKDIEKRKLQLAEGLKKKGFVNSERHISLIR